MKKLKNRQIVPNNVINITIKLLITRAFHFVLVPIITSLSYLELFFSDIPFFLIKNKFLDIYTEWFIKISCRTKFFIWGG